MLTFTHISYWFASNCDFLATHPQADFVESACQPVLADEFRVVNCVFRVIVISVPK